MIGLWLKGILATRRGRLLAAIAGLALAVGLLGSLGAFVVSSAQTMAHRAIAGLPVDWQALVGQGADIAAVTEALDQAARHTALAPVGYADVEGFAAKTGDTTQTTGPGKVLGLETDYSEKFPGQLRVVLGSADGVLIATQTAANLHVGPGDSVTIQRVGVAPADVRIAGVVALPNVDSMFQAIGVPKGLAPQAPPDNILIMPMAQWHSAFDAQAAARPDTVKTQLHVRLVRDRLPPDPSAAFLEAQRSGYNFEARAAGSAALANNLAARLDAVRADALYARVLFLFLGAPGVVLALLVTIAVAASGSDRRRREQALLRMRGATIAQVINMAAVESVVIGIAGALAGLALSALAAVAWWHMANIGLAAPWFAFAAAVGLVLAIAAFVLPAWREATQSTVSAARAEVGREPAALWQRLYIDLALLAIGAILFWTLGRDGYHIVLAPEGVPQTSVHYEAFLAPVLMWIGAGLLSVRIGDLILGRGRRGVTAAMTPLAGGLAPLVAASLSRQRQRIAGGVALVSLAFAFATATAIFNTTYDAQARVDAELTNGADVTVTGTSGAPAGQALAELRNITGVTAAEPLMHRFAYVGSDLQDLFGIDPARITNATSLSNAYFGNHDAAKTLELLKQTSDGVLVSEETVKDFQLNPGYTVNLRLQSAVDRQYHAVPFRFTGVTREFPSAPKDSFLVANSEYVARQTGSGAAEVVLLRTSGNNDAVAAAARRVVARLPGAKVTTLGEAQAIISSSLTAVDLRGLTRLELGFSILMIAGVTGLVLGLGLAERRRDFTILAALGAKPRQIGAFLWGEGLLIVLGGAILGIVTGFGIAHVLVTILAGAFDPPPESLSIPWQYLAFALATALVCGALSIIVMRSLSSKPDLGALRGG